MKTLLAVSLLICSLCLIRGADSRRDPCRRGIDAIKYFSRAGEGCDVDLRGVGRQLRNSIDGNLTVDDVRYVFTNYCSTLFPALVQCSRHWVQSCPAAQKAFLNTVISQTGFACVPNTQQVQPNFLNLLSQLTDADLVDNDSCPGFRERAVKTALRGCSHNAMTRHGFASSEDFHQYVMEAGVQELLPFAAGFMNEIFECVVTHLRDSSAGCPQWKGMLLKLAMHQSIFPTFLGRSMTFTPAHFNQMFGFGRGASQQAGSPLSALFSAD